MTKQLTNVLIVLIVCVILTSCGGVARYVYSPPPANITYFKAKGDNKISATGSNGPNDRFSAGDDKFNHGYDIQAAYALSNHWFVGGSYFNRREKESAGPSDNMGYSNIFDTSTINYKRNIFELGGGYFVPLNDRSTCTFNLYGAYGFGKFRLADYGFLNGIAYARQHQNSIAKYSLQFGFNFMPSDYFHFSLTGRYSFVHFGPNSTNYTSSELSHFHLNDIDNNTITFFEPTLNLQIGLPECKWLKLDMSLTLCTDNMYVNKRKSSAAVGLSFDISKMKKLKR